VIEGQTQTFSATVTGGSATTVYWQVCLGVPLTSPPTQPTVCTPVPGVTISGQNTTLTGYGTITQNGIYTAPLSIPQTNPNGFVVMATSTVNSTAFGIAFVRVDSGVRVSLLPTSATIGTLESFAVTATVTGSSNTGVTWSVNNLTPGDVTTGTIVPGGSMCASPGPPNCATYTAPSTAMTATITATSAADPSQSGKTTITVSTAVDPKLTSTEPTSALQGAVQQDIYVVGTDFFSTSSIVVNGTALPTTWVSTTLMRAVIPGSLLTAAGPIPVNVERQNGDLSSSGPQVLAVGPAPPTVVASTPVSVPATNAGFSLNVTGGFFSPSATTATFAGFPGTGTGVSMSMTINSGRQMLANIPAGALTVPGLYPIVLQNNGVTSGHSTAFTNLAVEPPAGSLAGLAASATITVGSSPSAIAIDQADGYAVIANTGSNTVSIINLALIGTASNPVIGTVATGNAPTGVAVDDGLATPIAVVVNSGDNTVSTINLATQAVSAPFALPPLATPQPGQKPPAAYSIGINPASHHGVVAYQSTNEATVLDFSTGAPQMVLQIGGTNTNYGTGPQPQISVDPRLNWAVVTAGGGGIGNVNFVDLGRNAVPAVDPGRAPSAVATLTFASLTPSVPLGVTGVGVNAETHQVLFTTPNQGSFSTFSLLDQTVSSIPFKDSQGGTLTELGYVAAAVSALPNIGVAVNKSGDTTVANTAAILDLQNHLVLGQVSVGNGPVAVAVDATTNQALVVNQTDGTVSVISLGTIRSSASFGSAVAPQITVATPEIAYVSGNAVTLTVNGGGFESGAQVYLDGTPVPSTLNARGRQITATIPASMLSAPRRYAVYVQNPGQSLISNMEDLTMIQPVSVGAQPFGVAIDPDCDVAAVTNTGDGTVSVVALTANAAPPGKICASNGAIGVVGSPIPVGTSPQGIAVEPRLGLAVVANNGGSNASVVDLTETNPPSTFDVCGGTCTGLSGVTIDHDTETAYIAGVQNTAGTMQGNVAQVTLPTSTTVPSTPSSSTAAGNLPFFLQPVAAAFDQYLDYLGVAIAGQGTSNEPSTVQVYNVPEANTVTSSSGFALPTGIVFDPVNQVFVVADSLTNNLGFVDPVTAVASFAQVGMNPTALDYNFNTSTLVTANNASHTMSIIQYVCPPTITTVSASCAPPQVESILPVGGSPQFSVAIDTKLNLAVLTDEANNRVLLIPLP
jgi:DNA-binding beta-propeller fold protein YncE